MGPAAPRESTMQSFAISARGAFKTAMTAGAVALTVAGATLATAEPAAAFARHGGFHHGGFHHGAFHHGGFRHGGFADRFAAGRGRFSGGYGFRHGGFGFRPYAYGVRRFAYGVGVPLPGYGLRRCGYARHFVPGLGCRLNVVYRAVPRFVPVRFGVRPFGYAVYRHHGFGFGRFAHAHGRAFAGVRHAFRPGGFHHAGFHRG